MTDDRERWALILGASSGMGEATARALAAAGYRIFGIHLDFRAALAHVEEVKAAIEAAGSEALYINMNAADDEKRAAALADAPGALRPAAAPRAATPYVRVVMHSLAFGSLVPFIADDPKAAVDRKKMEMTQDVMANSLVYWVQDLYRGGFLEQRLEGLRDDVRGVEPGRPVATASCRRPRPPSSRTSASWRWSSPGAARGSPSTRSGPGVTDDARPCCKIPEHER